VNPGLLANIRKARVCHGNRTYFLKGYSRQEPLKLLRPVQAYPRLSLVRRTIQPFSRKPRGWLLQCGCDISRDGIRLDASEKWFRELFQNSEETFSTICVLGGYYLNRR